MSVKEWIKYFNWKLVKEEHKKLKEQKEAEEQVCEKEITNEEGQKIVINECVNQWKNYLLTCF